MKKKSISPRGSTKRRNLQEASLRDVRALKTRIAQLEKRVATLEDAIVVSALSAAGTRRRK